MTPLEFNKIGAQSQLEIFETYFDSLNQQLRVPQANTDYADRVVNLDEKISIFKDYGNATSVSSSNVFNLPNQYSGTSSATQQFTANPQSQTFTLSGNALALSNAGAITNVFVNDIELASTAYSISGATLTISSTITLNDIVVINLYPKDFYRLGQVLYQAGALPTEELQRVDRGELYHLLSSNLTKPTTVNPIYIYENNQLTVYPTEITSDLSVSYIRKPIPPIWSFQSGAQYTFQPVSSCNFELHSAEQIELILKILLYAGVVIKNPEIIQVAASQIQQENINQKS